MIIRAAFVEDLRRQNEDTLAIRGAEAALEEQFGGLFGEEAPTNKQEWLKAKNQAHQEAIVAIAKLDEEEKAHFANETRRYEKAQLRLQRLKALGARAAEHCSGSPIRLGPLRICATRAALFGKNRVPLSVRVMD